MPYIFQESSRRFPKYSDADHLRTEKSAIKVMGDNFSPFQIINSKILTEIKCQRMKKALDYNEILNVAIEGLRAARPH